MLKSKRHCDRWSVIPSCHQMTEHFYTLHSVHITSFYERIFMPLYGTFWMKFRYRRKVWKCCFWSIKFLNDVFPILKIIKTSTYNPKNIVRGVVHKWCLLKNGIFRPHSTLCHKIFGMECYTALDNPFKVKL